ncbi:MAG: hypothetical protein M3394_00765 [Actinomycetota bacterium]|nr:hypothetical protein [Actinomycetota bacterium]
MVLLFLAVIWAAVLVPPMLRARAEGRPADSIGNFRHQLSVLQRAAPGLVSPANSLRSPMLPRPVLYGGARPVSSEAARRARTLKRRRDVLFGLLGAMGGSLVLGMLPSLRVLWGLHLVLDALFVGYVALLVRMRNAAAEREMKLRFLPSGPAPEPALLLRRSAR